MSKQNFSNSLKKSFSSKETFDQWATDYDKEVQSVDYQAPKIVSEKVLEFISGGLLLDIGCGTGLLAKYLKEKTNNFIIDGCDYSQAMIDVANTKNLYRSLSCCDINNLPFDDSIYDVITSVGVFASQQGKKDKGSPDAESLTEVIRILKSGGYFIFTISERIMKTDGDYYEKVISQLPVKVIEKIEKPYHQVIPTMQCLVLQKN